MLGRRYDLPRNQASELAADKETRRNGVANRIKIAASLAEFLSGAAVRDGQAVFIDSLTSLHQAGESPYFSDRFRPSSERFRPRLPTLQRHAALQAAQ